MTSRLPAPPTKCPRCGGSHALSDHHLPDMPQDPAELTGDFIKMGVYSDATLDLAKQLTRHQLREALFLNTVAGDNAERRQLCIDLMQQAGGLDAAFAAAFGDRASELFDDTIRCQRFGRRQFLTRVLTAAALVSLANCASHEELESDRDLDLEAQLEKRDLKIGFIPITCATPIIMSSPLGFYEKHGLNVELVKMNSWPQVRESAIAGELDAYHMLSPMPIAMTLGLDSTAFPIKLASIENINGQAIAVSLRHREKVKTAADFKGFTIGVPYPYSMHNLLLRYYLAANKVNPDRDVNIKIIPPPEGVERMRAGEIDAFLLPDNNSQQAVFDNVGFIHTVSRDIWPGHPCCAFAASKRWIDRYPNTFRAVNKAIIDGANYASSNTHRQEVARAIAAPEYLDTSEQMLAEVMTGQFNDGLGNSRNIPDRIDFDPYPWKSFSYWITTQFVRWNLMPGGNVEHENIADEVFLTGLARQLAKQLGQTPPTIILRYEKLNFDTFDPAEPEQYLKQQVEKYGF